MEETNVNTIDQPVNTAIASTLPTESLSEKPLAKIRYRYAAATVDGAITGILSIPIAIVIVLIGREDLSEDVFFNVIVGLITFSYYVILLKRTNTSWGKKFFHLRVETTDGSEITWGKALRREVLGKIIGSIVFMLGYIWAVFDKRKQAWHDKLAKTIVVQTEEVTGFKKFLVYFFLLIVPLTMVCILAAIVFVAVDTAQQLDRSRQTEEVNPSYQIDEFSPSPIEKI